MQTQNDHESCVFSCGTPPRSLALESFLGYTDIGPANPIATAQKSVARRSHHGEYKSQDQTLPHLSNRHSSRNASHNACPDATSDRLTGMHR